MAPLTAAVLESVSSTQGVSLGQATESAESLRGRVSAFDDAMNRQSVLSGEESFQVAQLQSEQGPVGTTDAEELARRALELDGTAKKPSGGDLILDGLQKLRSTFDARQERVASVMHGSVVDAQTLLAIQVEFVNYSLLVDVTSKLTGKSTQSFDTLMKGQ